MDPFVLAATYFLTVHGPDNEDIAVNVAEISSIRGVHDFEGHIAEGVVCVLIMTNGKAVPSIEPCNDIIRRIFEMHPERGEAK